MSSRILNQPSKPQTRRQRRAQKRRQQNNTNATRRIVTRARRFARAPRIRLGTNSQVAAPLNLGWTGTSFARQYTRGGVTYIESREMFPVDFHPGATPVLDFMLPANPAQWISTRTAQIASTYAAYRPIRMKITWCNATGTSVAGTVAVGTCFAGTTLPITTRAAATTGLPVTNGGFVTSIWSQHASYVRLSTSLRANNFPTTEIQADDIPFWILASFNGYANNNQVNLGYIILESVFTLHNPTVGGNLPSAASSVSASIAHSDATQSEDAASVLGIPVTSNIQLPNLSVGDDFFFAPGNEILNTSGAIINKVLQPLHATFKETSGGYHFFEIDPNIATLSFLLVSLIGKGANFISSAI